MYIRRKFAKDKSVKGFRRYCAIVRAYHLGRALASSTTRHVEFISVIRVIYLVASHDTLSSLWTRHLNWKFRVKARQKREGENDTRCRLRRADRRSYGHDSLYGFYVRGNRTLRRFLDRSKEHCHQRRTLGFQSSLVCRANASNRVTQGLKG